jgi:predicted nucleic acid-binding protein
MKRVLVDTGPLVALCDERDSLHARARRELDALKGTLCVGLPVLTEAHYLLPDRRLRLRLQAFFTRELMRAEAPERSEAVTARSLEWLRRYADHAPDFTDAFLVCWAEADAAASVWTFDREFVTTWRTLSGKRVKLA